MFFRGVFIVFLSAASVTTAAAETIFFRIVCQEIHSISGDQGDRIIVLDVMSNQCETGQGTIEEVTYETFSDDIYWELEADIENRSTTTADFPARLKVLQVQLGNASKPSSVEDIVSNAETLHFVGSSEHIGIAGRTANRIGFLKFDDAIKYAFLADYWGKQLHGHEHNDENTAPCKVTVSVNGESFESIRLQCLTPYQSSKSG